MDQLRAMLVAGVRGGKAAAEPAAQEYDWNRPCRFGRAQFEQLAAALNKLAGAAGRRLSSLLRNTIELKAQPLAQVYAAALRKQGAGEAGKRFGSALVRDGKCCGRIEVAKGEARQWVARLLGGGSEAAEQREMSDVERELLDDIFGALAAELSGAMTAGGGKTVALAGAGAGEEIEGADDAEYCVVGLAVGDAKEPAVVVTVLSESLEPLSGRKTAAQKPEAAAAALREHFARVGIEAEVLAGSAKVTMGQVLALEPGDVLLLDQRTNEPAKVLVEGRVVLQGTLVSCDGQYGLRIVGGTSAARNTK